jgi:hypothetical protein
VGKPNLGWVPAVFLEEETAPAANQSDVFFRMAWRSGLLREWNHVALTAVSDIFFKAQMVRAELDAEHLNALRSDDLQSVARAQELTLQTLNDLAYLYSWH